jgi:hypothetical protein
MKIIKEPWAYFLAMVALICQAGFMMHYEIETSKAIIIGIITIFYGAGMVISVKGVKLQEKVIIGCHKEITRGAYTFVCGEISRAGKMQLCKECRNLQKGVQDEKK